METIVILWLASCSLINCPAENDRYWKQYYEDARNLMTSRETMPACEITETTKRYSFQIADDWSKERLLMECPVDHIAIWSHPKEVKQLSIELEKGTPKFKVTGETVIYKKK